MQDQAAPTLSREEVRAAWDRDELDTTKEALASPAASILKECPQFRILVIGGTGVGKSTICKQVFGIDELRAGVSHGKRGTHDINHGLTFPGQNEHVIIHDSQGFEGGERETFDEVVKFIRDRRQETTLREQLHCIWYCISCEKESRPIQHSEEEFFANLPKLVGQIPVVVVFTKYDTLVAAQYAGYVSENLDDIMAGVNSVEDRKYEVRDRARKKFNRTWNKQWSTVINDIRVPSVTTTIIPAETKGDLRKILESEDSNVQQLVNMTVRNLVNHDLKLLWATAQNQWAELKCEKTIEEAMTCFPSSMAWDSVPLLPGISGWVFWRNFTFLFSKISPCWNIVDSGSLLTEASVQRNFIRAIYNANAWGRIALKCFDIFGFLDAPATAVMLANAVAGIILLHEDLFYLQKSQVAKNQEIHSLTKDELTTVLETFRASRSRRSMADTISGSYPFFKAYSKNKVTDVIRDAVRVARAQQQRNFD